MNIKTFKQNTSTEKAIQMPDQKAQTDKTAGVPDEEGELIYLNKQGTVNFNQGAIAAQIAKEHHLIFELSERDFYKYYENSGLWVKLTETQVSKLVDQSIRTALINAEHGTSLPKLNKQLFASIVHHLAQRTERGVPCWGKEKVLHVNNGMVDISSGTPELKLFSPDYLSRNQIPVDYQKDAKCERMTTDLLTPCVIEEDQELVQRFAGSFLLNKNSAQMMLFISGAAAGGKSTFVDLIEQIIGEENTYELRTQHLHERFEIQFYNGKKLLTGKDVPGNFLQAKGAYALKKLVGGDRISIEKKGLNTPIQIVGSFHILITSNTQLHVVLDGDSAAWARRIAIIEWGLPPENRKRIPHFASVLFKTEGSGILNWMIEGAIKHLLELDDIGKFRLSYMQQDRVDNLLNESDSVRSFISRSIQIDENSTVTTRQLYNAYEDHCIKNGWYAKTQREFELTSPEIIQTRLKIKRSHDIPFGGTTRRGYRNMKIIR